ncbi:dihydroorotase [Flavobacterium silvaticum]|uniref:Dihydroorotase n=1 Tax=Flavobacterium silvaticum TaxID=1852020 RepID=A0A972JEE8_9FLAO|nr:dihydroorotase [Flavobacterium silvaticum]NMH26804.1 dihydroorotase [Flavobacterium silvaticum]
MKLFIKQATILDESSAHHQQVRDLIIENGIITQIGASLENTNNYKEVSAEGLHISQGWFDSSVSFGEPGFEDRETIENGLATAAASGFTAVALQPNTNPVIDSASQLQLVHSKAVDALTQLYPIGALTSKSEGKDLAELFEMSQNGAIAFGDYAKYMDNANLLKISLQYAKDFDGLVIAFSQETSLKGNGVANEGLAATRLGLKGIPTLAEDLAVARNLQILEYTGGKMHIPTVSSPVAVGLIKEAKAKGLQVSCSVAVHHLVLTDDSLETFDTRQKTMPPLRNEQQRKALVKAVKDGTIDMITSDHNPIDIENKKMEFDLAKSGTIGLESAFAALMTVLPVETIVNKLTLGRLFFGVEPPQIIEGAAAELTFFTTEGSWVFQSSDIKSKSKNSAFLGRKLKGKVLGTLRENKLVWS